MDRATGVVRGIKVLGLHSRIGREYLPDALGRAVALYEGAKVNVNHPKGNPLAPRDYQERIGIIRNVQYRSGDGLFPDFHFNPKHYLAEQLAWDAEHARKTSAFRTTCKREPAGAAKRRWSRKLCKFTASIWWPIRRPRAECSNRRPPTQKLPSMRPWTVAFIGAIDDLITTSLSRAG